MKWIKILYTNANACIKNNNWISRSFKTHRGIRQGCPISALIFILVTEILAINIKTCKEIRGIKLPTKDQTEAKISQLADDTTIFVRDKDSIMKVLDVVKTFGKFAGPKLNESKTVGMWLGNLRSCTENVGNISWTSDPVKALGVYFGHDQKTRNKLNWESKIECVHKCLNTWKKRNLSLIGRILIVKSLAVSKLVYIASVSSSCEMYLKKIHKLIYNFIWNGKRDGVKRASIMAGKNEGGLNMINFYFQEKACKMIMLKRIIEPGNQTWKILPRYFLNKYGEKYLVLHMNVPKHVLEADNSIPHFYKNLISTWYSCKFQPLQSLLNVRDIRHQILWGNSLIKYKGKMLYYPGWIKKKIIYINDVFDVDGNFKEKELLHKLCDQNNHLAEVFMLKNAVCTEWKKIIKDQPCNLQIKKNMQLRILTNQNKVVNLEAVGKGRIIYDLLVHKHKKAPSCKTMWSAIFSDKNITWSNVYHEKLIGTKESKLVAFNYKILNNILATPYKLWKWKICEFCICHLCFSIGNLEHSMLLCPYFTDYYNKVKTILDKIGFSNVKIDMYTLVCGHKPKTEQYRHLNGLLNVIFFTVYKCWMKIYHDRKYINPLYILIHEMHIRCKSSLYNHPLYGKFVNNLIDIVHV